MAKNLKAALKARVGTAGHYTADEGALLVHFGKAKDPVKLDKATGEAIYNKSKAYKVDGARRARNAVRKLVRQGLVQPLGDGLYQATGGK